MIVSHSLKDCKIEKSAIALGKFDGLHLGHQSIIEELKRNKDENTKTVVITFVGSPKAFLENQKQKYIMTEKEKERYFENLGIDYLIWVPLDKAFFHLEAETFIKEYLIDRLGMVKVVSGKNFRFGKQRKGDTTMLAEFGKAFGYETVVAEDFLLNCQVVSSSLVREAIQCGNLQLANQMLGRPFLISGIVESGNQLGRTISFPTVNLLPKEEKILPPNGVYSSVTKVFGNSYKSITNIGIKPTVEGQNKLGVETHILEFQDMIYGEEIEVELLDFIRPEKKFDSIEDLKRQIQMDLQQA